MLIKLYFFITGTTIGSFLTLCFDRSQTHQSIIWPRSHCSNCQTTLKLFDLIPIVSYCLLNGKCRFCHQKFSPTSCLIELTLGTLYLQLADRSTSPLELSSKLVVVTLLVYLSLVDLKTTSVNGMWIGLLGLTGIIEQFTPINLLLFSLLVLSLFTRFQFSNIIKGLGEADFELILVFGILLTIQAIPKIIWLASGLCLIFKFCFPYFHKRKTPFIPYLVFGYLMMIF